MGQGASEEVKAWVRFGTPVGWLEVRAREEGVVAVELGVPESADERGSGQALAWARQAREELQAYFSGRQQGFSVPLLLSGTAFQQAVWHKLLDIPYGQTTTYGTLARALGKAGAARAVGAACAANPIPILVPCHRVVGSGGTLTGFAGGLELKAKLLALEQRHL